VTASPPPAPRAFSRTDLFEIVALAVLGPIAWLTPQWLWARLSRALSLAIAWGRPGITRERVATLAVALGPRRGDHELGKLRRLRVAIMDGYMEERLQILRDWRPGGWRPAIELVGRAHVDAALAAGRGVVLWTAPFSYADLIVKMALARAGYALHHLSAFSRGFSPNSCYAWTPTRFGRKVLSPLRTRIEDRYLAERIVVAPDGGLGYVRRIEQCLRDGGIVSMRAGDAGQRVIEVPFLEGRIQLASGAASLAIATDAVLLPVVCVPTGPGRFRVAIEAPLAIPPGVRPHQAVESVVADYAAQLERWVLRNPELWSGWYQMRLPGDATAAPTTDPVPRVRAVG
jgi:lauroyl/myristoyl acyltransferase